MRRLVILLAVLSPAMALVPENLARPAIRGFSTIEGICPPAGNSGERLSGQGGTLKACANRCTKLGDSCKGFNFVTDAQQCTIFDTACDSTTPIDTPGSTKARQNFYLKGEIECQLSTHGDEFYVAFMANRVAQPKNMKLEIWLTQDSSMLEPLEIKVSVDPSAVGTLGVNDEVQTLSIGYKEVRNITIDPNWKITDKDSGVTIEKKALKLEARKDFVLYGVNKEYFTADAFLGVPSRALGTRYVVTCHWPPFYNCEFAITPVDRDTHVRITLPRAGATRNTGKSEFDDLMKAPQDKDRTPTTKCALPHLGRTYTNGDSFNVTLQEFDVVQIQDLCDLTGTIIEADGQIAVWSGDSRSNVGNSPSRDHLVEQLFSTDTWGYECAAWPTPNRLPTLVDTWVITAATDGTRVRVDSSEAATVYYDLNAGESVRFAANSVTEWMRFSSPKKFQSAQYSHSAVDPKVYGDPSVTLCIPSDQFGFGYTFVIPTGVSTTYVSYLTIITKSGSQNGFLLDGKSIRNINWNPIPNSNLVGGYVLLDTSMKQTFRVNHTVAGTSFEAYIYGAGDRESVAYPTGACLSAIGDCVGSTMFIADGKDNDCDGVIDEELCDGQDNDFDGQTDEDCYEKRAVAPPPSDRCPKVLNATACYNNQLQLSCDDGSIQILDAHFGRIGRPKEMMCGPNAVDSCTGSNAACGFTDVSGVVSTQCNGKQQCIMSVNSLANAFAPSACPTCSLYAHVQYACLNQKEQSSGALTGTNYVASSWLQTIAADTCSASGASSVATYHPSQADFKVSDTYGWRPAACDKNSSWLQVDLGGQYNVGWYAISGCRRDDMWVTKFGISYSLDGKRWTNVLDSDGSLRQFNGNTDATSIKVCDLFSLNIAARWLRIWPLAYDKYPCAHIDFGHSTTLLGCTAQSVANSNLANGGVAALGTPISVTCSPGWTTPNGASSYEVQCGADGNWGASFRDCSNLRSCPDIPQVAGGYGNARNNLVGSTVTFGCLNGRTLNGPSYATCQADGKWSSAAPTCDQQ